MAAELAISDLEINSLEDVFRAVRKAQQALHGPPIWWRGETSNRDRRDRLRRLVPEVFRSKDLAKREREMFREFCAMAPGMYPRPPENMTPTDWLCFMRHYRVPTRLLDWTESVLAACFFATEEGERKDVKKESESERVLWALQPTKRNRRLMFYSSGKTVNDVVKNVGALKRKNTYGR